MEPDQPKSQQKDEEWYDEVYFDSDQDSEQEEEERSPGIGLMVKLKNMPSKYTRCDQS